EQPERRLCDRAHESRDGKERADACVRKPEVRSDQRPRGLQSAEDQLVEEFDREQGRDREGESVELARSSAEGKLPVHVRILRRHPRPSTAIWRNDSTTVSSSHPVY